MRLKKGYRLVDNYTQVPNAIYDDKRLQLQDVGLYASLCRHIEGWDITVEKLAEQRGEDGYHKINASVKRLEAAGWLVRHRYRDAEGKIQVDLTLEDISHLPSIIEGSDPVSEGENHRTRKPRDAKTAGTGNKTITSIRPSLEENAADAARGASKPRERDQVWDALSSLFGEPSTEGAKKDRGKIVRSLKAAGDATPTEIRKRWARLNKVMPNLTHTQHSLEKHWHTLTDAAPAGAVDDDPKPDWRNPAALEAWERRQEQKRAAS